jgi:hypothetical protein
VTRARAVEIVDQPEPGMEALLGAMKIFLKVEG